MGDSQAAHQELQTLVGFNPPDRDELIRAPLPDPTPVRPISPSDQRGRDGSPGACLGHLSKVKRMGRARLLRPLDP